ncbi:UbiA family prenyltransferase, partial [Neisseria elongata]
MEMKRLLLQMLPRYAVGRMFVYSRLMRVEKPIGTLLLLWPTLWALWIASEGVPDLMILAAFSMGTFLMRSAGCVVNDFADRDIDGAVERTKSRPFARGLVTKSEALLLLLILCMLAALCLL